MNKILTSLIAFLIAFAPALRAQDNTFLDYQNYNHGYCPECNCYPCCCGSPNECAPCQAPCDPCDPCAPVCGAECGISICAVGIGIGALAVAAAIIIASSDGSSSVHSHD